MEPQWNPGGLVAETRVRTIGNSLRIELLLLAGFSEAALPPAAVIKSKPLQCPPQLCVGGCNLDKC